MSDLLWRIIQGEVIVVLALLCVILVLFIWWLLRKLVAVPVLSVDTDKDSYFRAETIGISGSLMLGENPLPNETVGLAIKPPTGDAFSLPSVTTETDGSFAASWTVPADAEAGSYELIAAGGGVGATAAFTLEAA